MILDVHVSGRVVVKSYREWDEYVLKCFPVQSYRHFARFSHM